VISYINQIMLILGKPFKEPIDNKFTLFEELMISFYLYGFLGLKDF